MSVEENKERFNQFIEQVFNQGNLDLIEGEAAADSVDHSLPPGMPTDIQGTKMAIASFRKSFPDIHITNDIVMGEGDLVMGYQTIRATHHGEFLGIPPTGMSFQVESMSIVRFANGKTAEHWAMTDVFGLMQQIGAMERPG